MFHRKYTDSGTATDLLKAQNHGDKILLSLFRKNRIMKYIYILIAFTLITVLTFCTGEKETKTHSAIDSTIQKRLSEDDMFNEDSITYAMATSTLRQKDESRKCFLRGLDLLMNKQKAKESVAMFRDAILFSPDRRVFYFLAKAYIELNDAEHAREANNICSSSYDPYYEPIFNDALISAIQQDTVSCINYLNQAVFEGFLNKNRILDEKRFDFVRDDPRYVSLIVNTFNDDAKLKALLFKNYLKAFPDLSLPYAEPVDSVRNHNYPYINYDYAAFIPNMEDGRFARDVTNEYFAVGKIKVGNNYAMIYKTYLAIADTLNPVKTFVVTYDSLGTVVDEEMIGCFCTPTLSQAYSISQEGTIEITPYNYKWKNDPLEKGYAGNEVISAEADKPVQMQLIEGGEIRRDKVAETDAAIVSQDGSRGG